MTRVRGPIDDGAETCGGDHEVVGTATLREEASVVANRIVRGMNGRLAIFEEKTKVAGADTDYLTRCNFESRNARKE